MFASGKDEQDGKEVNGMGDALRPVDVVLYGFLILMDHGGFLEVYGLGVELFEVLEELYLIGLDDDGMFWILFDNLVKLLCDWIVWWESSLFALIVTSIKYGNGIAGVDIILVD